MLAGLVALTHRILLLLSGFLAAALLLTWALGGILILLSGILGLLFRHREFSLVGLRRNNRLPGFGCQRNPVPSTGFGIAEPKFEGPRANETMHKPLC